MFCMCSPRWIAETNMVHIKQEIHLFWSMWLACYTSRMADRSIFTLSALNCIAYTLYEQNIKLPFQNKIHSIKLFLCNTIKPEVWPSITAPFKMIYRIIPIKRPGTYVSNFRWALIEMLKNSAKDRYLL